MNDKTASSMVVERLSIADDGRAEYSTQAVENEKLYRAYIDETTHPYLSNICLPWPYIITESYLGKCIQMLAAMLPYVRVVEEDDDSRPKAKRVERDANMVLYMQKWPILAYKLYKQSFKYPCGWLEEAPWGVIDGREMPIFRVRNWFKTWVNPTITELDDPDAYVITEDFVPLAELKKLQGNSNYKNLSKILPHEGDRYDTDEQEIRAFKEIPETPLDPYSNLVQVWKYWDHDRFIVTTNEGDNVIRNSENFLGGHIPFKKITPIPLEDEFYGMAIIEEGKDLFAEANENRNQFNDAVNLMLNPQWIVSRSCELKRSTIVTRAGNIIWTDDVNGITPMQVDWNILTASLARHKQIESDIQNFSNAFPQMRGQQTSGDQTATEYMGMRSAGELRSDTYNLILAMMSVEDMLKDIVFFKKMFMTQPDSFYYWPEAKTQSITPDDYNGNFTFKAVAQYKMQREIERKQFIEAMTFIFGKQAFMPLVMPRVDEWLDRLLGFFDLRNPEQLWASPQEMMMQQMMQMMGGGVPQLGMGGQQPALGEKEMRTPDTSPNVGTAPMIGGMNA